MSLVTLARSPPKKLLNKRVQMLRSLTQRTSSKKVLAWVVAALRNLNGFSKVQTLQKKLRYKKWQPSNRNKKLTTHWRVTTQVSAPQSLNQGMIWKVGQGSVRAPTPTMTTSGSLSRKAMWKWQRLCHKLRNLSLSSQSKEGLLFSQLRQRNPYSKSRQSVQLLRPTPERKTSRPWLIRVSTAIWVPKTLHQTT